MEKNTTFHTELDTADTTWSTCNICLPHTHLAEEFSDTDLHDSLCCCYHRPTLWSDAISLHKMNAKKSMLRHGCLWLNTDSTCLQRSHL